MKKVVLITGVAGGIGKATAQLFKDSEWTVVGVDIKVDDLSKAIDRYVQADCSDADQVLSVIKSVEKNEGRLDALINNAAIQICKPLIETTVEEWDQTMGVNLRSAFLFSKFGYGLLKENQGAIVNVSSVHANATSSNIAAYAASKGGLSAFTRALAIEFASAQIRVNAVLPGAVDTAMLHAGLTRECSSVSSIEEMMEGLAAKTVLQRVGKPHEIAQAIYFLAENQRSSFVTGQALVVDGGATARLSTVE